MADKETLYLDHGNTIDLVLKSDDEAVDLSTVTGIRVMFDQTSIYSNNGSQGPIKWQIGSADANWQTGEIRIDCSSHDINPARYKVPIIVYDPTNTDGVVWDYLQIEVKEAS